MIIREATDADWAEIYPFFRSIVEEGETFAYPRGLSAAEAKPVWMEGPPSHVAVAVEGERVVGSVNVGPNRPGRGSHVATASFMVDPGYQGHGVGRALGSYALEWAKGHGYRSMQFNAVVETNASAVRLWQSLGFQILATVPEAFEHPEHGFVGLHIMWQPL